MEAIYKALNDTTRRAILEFLLDGPKNAGQIANQFDMTKPSISHHLDLLKQANLVESAKKGQFIEYILNKQGFEPINDWFIPFRNHFEFPKPKIRL
ncbi:MAG: hypothetical protein RIR51_343 [Bacteroidota bacterium]|jgi:DNA-binding transcriptional ArsR family regulator